MGSQRISGSSTPILPLKPIEENNVYDIDGHDIDLDNSWIQYAMNNKDIIDYSPRSSITTAADMYSATVSALGSTRCSLSLESTSMTSDSDLLSSELFDIARSILSSTSRSSLDLNLPNNYEYIYDDEHGENQIAELYEYYDEFIDNDTKKVIDGFIRCIPTRNDCLIQTDLVNVITAKYCYQSIEYNRGKKREKCLL